MEDLVCEDVDAPVRERMTRLYVRAIEADGREPGPGRRFCVGRDVLICLYDNGAGKGVFLDWQGRVVSFLGVCTVFEPSLAPEGIVLRAVRP